MRVLAGAAWVWLPLGAGLSCLSLFQAALSIRESAALTINLRGASRLPAPACGQHSTGTPIGTETLTGGCLGRGGSCPLPPASQPGHPAVHPHRPRDEACRAPSAARGSRGREAQDGLGSLGGQRERCGGDTPPVLPAALGAHKPAPCGPAQQRAPQGSAARQPLNLRPRGAPPPRRAKGPRALSQAQRQGNKEE